MSMDFPYLISPKISYGAIKAGVPTKLVIFYPNSNYFANPKSARRGSFCSFTKILGGLISR
jgi:hypothetical protein